IVVGPVIQLHLEVHHGIPRDRPTGGRLDHATLDGGDVLARYHAPDDLIVEHEAGAARQRRDADPAVAVLPATAGLLLVLALPFGFAAQRFAVRDLRLPD